MSKKDTHWHGDKPFNRFIKDQYEIKKKGNPKYSIRAFASYLGVDQSLLTKVLNGERTLSRKMMELCLRKMKADEELISSLTKIKNKIEFRKLDDHVFGLISDWKYMAILEALTLKNFSFTTESLSTKFGLDQEEVSRILAQLKDLSFIDEVEGSFVIKNLNNSWTNNHATSVSRKTLQRRILEKSIESLESVPFELRDHGSVTLALNKSLMPRYKEILTRFRKELIELVQLNDDFDEVYQLSIALFPLSKIDPTQILKEQTK